MRELLVKCPRSRVGRAVDSACGGRGGSGRPFLEVIPGGAGGKVKCSFQIGEIGHFNFTSPEALNIRDCTKRGDYCDSAVTLAVSDDLQHGIR